MSGPAPAVVESACVTIVSMYQTAAKKEWPQRIKLGFQKC